MIQRLLLRILTPGYLEKYAFLLVQCTGQNVLRAMRSSQSWFYMNQCIISQRRPPNDSYFWAPDIKTLTYLKTIFTFLPTVTCDLKVALDVDNIDEVSLYQHCTLFQLRVDGWNGRQTDGQV